MTDAHDLYNFVRRLIQDDVLADRKRANANGEFRALSAETRKAEQLLESLLQASHQPLGSFRVVRGDVLPDFQQVLSRRFGDSQFHRRLPLFVLLLPRLPRASRLLPSARTSLIKSSADSYSVNLPALSAS